MESDEQHLEGGIANLGKVVRVGDTVRRPANACTEAVFALLQHLHDVGFERVPRPLGIDEQGREVLTFIDGNVPIPPFPVWSMSDAALVSVARLLRRFHEAAADFGLDADRWNDELADPLGGSHLIHNDICPENVVFRDGEAFALLDWDFAAPGRPGWDAVAVMSMWGRCATHPTPHPAWRDWTRSLGRGWSLTPMAWASRSAVRSRGSSWSGCRSRWWRTEPRPVSRRSLRCWGVKAVPVARSAVVVGAEHGETPSRTGVRRRHSRPSTA